MISEKIMEFCDTRRFEVLNLADEGDEREIFLVCLDIINFLKLYCKWDRERYLSVNKNLYYYRSLEKISTVKGFGEVFSLSENQYEIQVRIRTDIPDEFRAALISTVCEKYIVRPGKLMTRKK